MEDGIVPGPGRVALQQRQVQGLGGPAEPLRVERLRALAERHPVGQHAAAAISGAALPRQAADLVGDQNARGVRPAEGRGGNGDFRQHTDGSLRVQPASKIGVKRSPRRLEHLAVGRFHRAEIEPPHRQAVGIGQEAAGPDSGLETPDEYAGTTIVGGPQRVRVIAHGQRSQVIEELPPQGPQRRVHVENLGRPQQRREDAAHRGEVLVGVSRAPDRLVAVHLVDVVLAVRAFPDVREVPVELRRALEHGVGAVAEPLPVQGVLIAAPVEVGDLRGRAEDVVDVAERSRAALGRHPAAVHPASFLVPVPPAGVWVFGLGVGAKTLRPLIPRLAQQVEVAHLGGDVVGQFLQTVKIHRLGDVQALAVPLLPRSCRARFVHAGVHVENGLEQLHAVGCGHCLVVAAQVGEPVLGAPGAQVAAGVPEHAVELGRELPAGGRGHQVQEVGVVLFDEVGCAIRAAQLDEAARPEVVPPPRGLGGQGRKSLLGGGFELPQRGLRNVLLRIHRGRAGDQDGELVRPRRGRKTQLRLVRQARPALAAGDPDRHRGLRAVAAFAELLGEHDAFAAHNEARCGHMAAGADGYDIVAGELLELLAEVLRGVAQHSKRHLDGRRRRPPVFHRNGHDVGRGRGQGARRHILALDSQKAVVEGQPLGETRGGEHVLTEPGEVDVHEAAAAAIVAMALGEAVGGAVVGVDIHAVDLHAQRCRRGPYQCAHAPVADGDALFATFGWFLVDEVGPRHELAVVDLNERAGGGHVAGGQRRSDPGREECPARKRAIGFRHSQHWILPVIRRRRAAGGQ